MIQFLEFKSVTKDNPMDFCGRTPMGFSIVIKLNGLSVNKARPSRRLLTSSSPCEIKYTWFWITSTSLPASLRQSTRSSAGSTIHNTPGTIVASQVMSRSNPWSSHRLNKTVPPEQGRNWNCWFPWHQNRQRGSKVTTSEAWTRTVLSDHYVNQRLKVSHLGDLLNLKKISSESSKELRYLLQVTGNICSIYHVSNQSSALKQLTAFIWASIGLCFDCLR